MFVDALLIFNALRTSSLDLWMKAVGLYMETLAKTPNKTLQQKVGTQSSGKVP